MDMSPRNVNGITVWNDGSKTKGRRIILVSCFASFSQSLVPSWQNYYWFERIEHTVWQRFVDVRNNRVGTRSSSSKPVESLIGGATRKSNESNVRYYVGETGLWMSWPIVVFFFELSSRFGEFMGFWIDNWTLVYLWKDLVDVVECHYPAWSALNSFDVQMHNTRFHQVAKSSKSSNHQMRIPPRRNALKINWTRLFGLDMKVGLIANV